MRDDDRDDEDRNVGCRRRRRRRAAVLPAASRGCRVSTWDGERRALVGLRVDGGRRRRAPRAVAPRRVRATSSNISGSVCGGGGLEVVSPGPCVLVLAAPRLGGGRGGCRSPQTVRAWLQNRTQGAVIKEHARARRAGVLGGVAALAGPNAVLKRLKRCRCWAGTKRDSPGAWGVLGLPLGRGDNPLRCIWHGIYSSNGIPTRPCFFGF
jgi:hypothetical protein